MKADGIDFRTDCDTEVLLAGYEKWGPDFLSKVDGMFAFGIVSLSEEGHAIKLTLARDLSGEKPLFYSRSSAEIEFGSDPRQVAECLTPRSKSVNTLLALGYSIPGEGFFEGIEELKPGYIVAFDLESEARDPVYIPYGRPIPSWDGVLRSESSWSKNWRSYS